VTLLGHPCWVRSTAGCLVALLVGYGSLDACRCRCLDVAVACSGLSQDVSIRVRYRPSTYIAY
jgi:hypothetical protein